MTDRDIIEDDMERIRGIKQDLESVFASIERAVADGTLTRTSPIDMKWRMVSAEEFVNDILGEDWKRLATEAESIEAIPCSQRYQSFFGSVVKGVAA